MIDAYLGVMRDRWERHSLMYALIANVNRDAKRQRQPYRPEQFNPYHEKPTHQKPAVKVSMGAMMDAVFDQDASRLGRELSEHG